MSLNYLGLKGGRAIKFLLWRKNKKKSINKSQLNKEINLRVNSVLKRWEEEDEH